MYQIFRYIGFSEAISFLMLLFIAMPLKYFWDHPEAVRIVGMAHGLLFIAYVIVATLLGIQMKWPRKFFIWAYISSTLPFGPFMFDKKIGSRST